MTLQDLSVFVHDAPESKWFYYVEQDEELLLVDEQPPDDQLVVAYHLQYVSKRRQRELMAPKLSRKAISRKGMKAIMSNDGESRLNLCKESLLDWVITPRGLFLLNAELDISKLDPTDKVQFNEINIRTLAERSDLATDIYGILTDHEEWFEGDAAGNSGSGRSGSSEEPPAPPASTDT